MQPPLIYDKIRNVILKEIQGVMAIYLFGSRADGTFNPDSDFDLGILLPPDKPINDLALFNLQQDLSSALNHDVDLICLNHATLIMQFQITSKGILIFEKDKTQILKFEALVLSMYQRFNEERRFILEEIETSGKIYSA
jgi:predicted nucleotidyltransferase